MGAVDRFMQKVVVDPDSGCWIWTGWTIARGYGRFHYEGRDVLAHRWAYEHFIGPIPEGASLDHLCRNTGCVNPEHVEPVSHRENVLRGQGPTSVNAAKTTCPQGHDYSPENTYIIPSTGSRRCRTCHRDASRERQRRIRS